MTYAPATTRDDRQGPARTLSIVILIEAIVIILLLIFRSCGTTAAALERYDAAEGELVLVQEPTDVGPNPYLSPEDRGGRRADILMIALLKAMRQNPPVTKSGITLYKVTVPKVGTYGGTLDNTCDPKLLVTFLTKTNPAKGKAWAKAQGIAFDDIANFVDTLTPTVLNKDTLITNYGYKGQLTSNPSMLRKGTAVLVNDKGEPLVRCMCGNPMKVRTTKVVKPPVDPPPPLCRTTVDTVLLSEDESQATYPVAAGTEVTIFWVSNTAPFVAWVLADGNEGAIPIDALPPDCAPTVPPPDPPSGCTAILDTQLEPEDPAQGPIPVVAGTAVTVRWFNEGLPFTAAVQIEGHEGTVPISAIEGDCRPENATIACLIDPTPYEAYDAASSPGVIGPYQLAGVEGGIRHSGGVALVGLHWNIGATEYYGYVDPAFFSSSQDCEPPPCVVSETTTLYGIDEGMPGAPIGTIAGGTQITPNGLSEGYNMVGIAEGFVEITSISGPCLPPETPTCVGVTVIDELSGTTPSVPLDATTTGLVTSVDGATDVQVRWTGPPAGIAWVRLDDMVIGRLCDELAFPDSDPNTAPTQSSTSPPSTVTSTTLVPGDVPDPGPATPTPVVPATPTTIKPAVTTIKPTVTTVITVTTTTEPPPPPPTEPEREPDPEPCQTDSSQYSEPSFATLTKQVGGGNYYPVRLMGDYEPDPESGAMLALVVVESSGATVWVDAGRFIGQCGG